MRRTIRWFLKVDTTKTTHNEINNANYPHHFDADLPVAGVWHGRDMIGQSGVSVRGMRPPPGVLATPFDQLATADGLCYHNDPLDAVHRRSAGDQSRCAVCDGDAAAGGIWAAGRTNLTPLTEKRNSTDERMTYNG